MLGSPKGSDLCGHTDSFLSLEAARGARHWLLWLPLELALDMGFLLPVHVEISVYSSSSGVSKPQL